MLVRGMASRDASSRALAVAVVDRALELCGVRELDRRRAGSTLIAGRRSSRSRQQKRGLRVHAAFMQRTLQRLLRLLFPPSERSGTSRPRRQPGRGARPRGSATPRSITGRRSPRSLVLAARRARNESRTPRHAFLRAKLEAAEERTNDHRYGNTSRRVRGCCSSEAYSRPSPVSVARMRSGPP